ncbi:MAG: hypothetical protein IJX36_00300 [Thermoguttaceae bacterium]|nr:hypothetical protein [Thermoguttaceae bacterium]MBQ8362352.1 hypothetical protein [Thermoguttaceae bacterium]
MNPLYPLILASGTKEALFAALWLALGEEPGRVVDATFADVRETAKRFGVSLSEQQIRKRVKELETLNVLEIVPRRERGRFDLYVYRPSPSRFPEPVAAKPEPETPFFDATFGKGVESFASVPVLKTKMETRTETDAEAVERREAASRNALETSGKSAVAFGSAVVANRERETAPKEEIIINIKNKKINQTAKDLEAETQAATEARSVADVRSLVDFESPKVAALRAEIAERVWEPTVHPDLIDRLTAAVVLRVGGATRSDVFALIREARDAKSLFERSNGRAGKRTVWETAALRTKRLFENAGWVWVPTRFADEPRPVDARRQTRPLERDRASKEADATSEQPVAELLAVAAGFEVSELELSFDDFKRLTRERRRPANAFEVQRLAFEIRSALRTLKEREVAAC